MDGTGVELCLGSMAARGTEVSVVARLATTEPGAVAVAAAEVEARAWMRRRQQPFSGVARGEAEGLAARAAAAGAATVDVDAACFVVAALAPPLQPPLTQSSSPASSCLISKQCEGRAVELPDDDEGLEAAAVAALLAAAETASTEREFQTEQGATFAPVGCSGDSTMLHRRE